MEEITSPELLEFHSLIAAIREEAALLKKTILSEDEEKEENDILREFGSAVQSQTFSTLNNLVLYQILGWRELLDE